MATVSHPVRSSPSHLLLPLVALSALAACGGGRPAKPAAAAASMTVTTATATRRSVEREVTASGSVAAWQEMSLGVELTGLRIASVLVEPGARVTAGQPLLELDRRTLDVQARQAEASLAQARASLELATAQATRGEALLAQNLISSANFDELRANRAKAVAQVAAAEAERDAAALRLGFATLRAPDAGVISVRNAQPGQVVSAGAELLRLIRRGRQEWRAEISDADLAKVRPGATVRLRAPDGAAITGSVRAVSPSVDPQTRTAVVYADLPDPGTLRAGMFAEGRIAVGRAEVSVVPRESVVFRDGLPYVFVLREGDRVEQRRIETGTVEGDALEVRSGLKADERIAVRGAGFLGDGETVKVVQGTPP
jgi:RND family efflux transporter MFP subunit